MASCLTGVVCICSLLLQRKSNVTTAGWDHVNKSADLGCSLLPAPVPTTSRPRLYVTCYLRGRVQGGVRLLRVATILQVSICSYGKGRPLGWKPSGG